MTNNKIKGELKDLISELAAEESEVIFEIATATLSYFEEGEDFFDNDETSYNDVDELIDEIKSLISELEYEDGSEQIIKIFKKVLKKI